MDERGPEYTAYIHPEGLSDMHEATSMLRSAGWDPTAVRKELAGLTHELVALAETVPVTYRDEPTRKYLQAVGTIAFLEKSPSVRRLGFQEAAPAVLIDRLVVPLPERRKGYGSKLLGHVIDTALNLQDPPYRTVIANTRGLYGRRFFEAKGFLPNPDDPASPYWSRPLDDYRG